MYTKYGKTIILLLILSVLLLNPISYAANQNSQAVVALSSKASVATAGGSSETADLIMTPVSAAAKLKDMDAVAQNDQLILYLNRTTTEVAVRDKATGNVWFSNPIDRKDDPIATSAVLQGYLSSQLAIQYYTPKANLPKMDNYNDSIIHMERPEPIQNFKVTKVDNGFKIVYTMGMIVDRGREVLPQVITKERLEELVLNKISTDINDPERAKVLYQYTRWDLSTVKTEQTKNTLIEKFPQIVDHVVYELKADIPEYKLKELIELFDRAGYTTDDLVQDNLENEIESAVVEQTIFEIPIVYQLEGDSLVVTVPREDIVTPESYPLYKIRLLEFFGAANHKSEGYIFVPDGSGALIRLNNKKTTDLPYNLPVYGDDLGIFRRTKSQVNEITRLPVFGMKNGEQAFFAIIEEGEANANIIGDIAGKTHSYNTVCAEFTMTPTDVTSVFGSVNGQNRILSMRTYQSRLNENDLRIRYTFLSGKDASYVGMAKYYQNYLVENYGLKKIEPKDNIPFYLEVVGGMYKQKPILGIPFNIYHPLTSYKQALSMIEDLKGRQIDNIKLKYTGWFNGGINHKIPTSIKPDKKLGGKNGFKDLVSNLKEQGIDLYPDVALQNIYKAGWFFDTKAECGWYMNKHTLMNVSYSIVDYAPETIDSNLLSPSKLASYTDKFLKSYSKFSVGGVSLRDLGNEILYSDFKKNKEVDRQQASDIITDQVKKIKEQGNKIMLDGGNASVLPYADVILNIPLDSSHMNICDETVPFYQMVVHGYLEYAGEPINLAQDYKKNLLKIIETGSAIYYKWIYEDSSFMKDTRHDDLYSVGYQNWVEDADEFYSKVNKLLKDVQDQRIVNHEILQKNVYRTTYENGKAVIVNYNKDYVEIDGIVIPGEDYYEVKGGDR